jgi:hypothetical protein
MAKVEEPRVTLGGRHYSASGEASRDAEKERIGAMSAFERMALALALGRRRRMLDQRRPAPVRSDG